MQAADKEATLLRGGYVYCLACGKPMTIGQWKRTRLHPEKRFAYRCVNISSAPGHRRPDHCGQSIAAAPLDAEVWAHVVRLAHEEAVLDEAMARYAARMERHHAREAAALRAAEHHYEMAQRDEANSLRTLTEETDEHYKARLRVQWKEAVAALEAAEAHLVAVQEQFARDRASEAYADVSAWAQEVRGRIASASYAEKRQMLHRLGLRVLSRPPRTRSGWGPVCVRATITVRNATTLSCWAGPAACGRQCPAISSHCHPYPERVAQA